MALALLLVGATVLPATVARPPSSGVQLVTNVRDLSRNQVGCPYAQRVWLSLELKKLKYERLEVDLRDKPAWLLPR